jgi:hypothetical protein
MKRLLRQFPQPAIAFGAVIAFPMSRVAFAQGSPNAPACYECPRGTLRADSACSFGLTPITHDPGRAAARQRPGHPGFGGVLKAVRVAHHISLQRGYARQIDDRYRSGFVAYRAMRWIKTSL